MSGLAFQKKNGSMTTAFQQLSELQEIKALALKSDLYKTAKEFCLGKTLTPVAKSWYIGFQETAVVNQDFGGLYFGKFQIQHSQQATANNDNGYKRSVCRLHNVSEVVAQTQINIHGDDILSWETAKSEHYGFATSVQLSTVPNDNIPQHSVVVSFIGYKLTQEVGFTVPPPAVVQNPNNSGNTSFTAQDLTSLGYTYQWSELNGLGSFINPNSPNTVFVPNGNGSYIVQLIVSDGDIEGEPIQIPVIVNNIPILLNSTGGITFNLPNGVSVEPNQQKTIYVSGDENPQVIIPPLHWRSHLARLLRKDGQVIDGYNNGTFETILGAGLFTLPAESFEFEFLYRLEEGRYIQNNLTVPVTFLTPSQGNRSAHTQQIAVGENLSFGDKREITISSPVAFSISNNASADPIVLNSAPLGDIHQLTYFDMSENGRNHSIEPL